MKMDGFDVDEAERKACGREKTESWGCAVVRAQHKRSKSASGNNLDLSRGGGLHPAQDFKSPELQSAARHPRAQKPIQECPSKSNTDSASTHRDLLEKDIEQLQLKLQQEKSMRMLLERALGRASSTLSPGHKQFANQTKELIAEIELLEEEVANREQHVLSLYRSIFENSVSRPSSEQSSVMTSPAHTKNEARKHPSIISSAFCSSKNFPLRHLHALATKNGSGKRNVLPSKTIRHASFTGKANAHFETSCSDHVKAMEKLSPMEKTSVQRTLKDHLYQCPSKLSEEMVKCMAAVYCWLRSSASGYQEQSRSPLLSRSSTNVVLPRRANGEEREWSCKSMVEISWISTDKNNFSRASYAINNYRLLVEQLERLNLRQMETNAQTAFWINMYNSLVMHAYLAYGIPHSSLRRLALFHKCRLLITLVVMS